MANSCAQGLIIVQRIKVHVYLFFSNGITRAKKNATMCSIAVRDLPPVPQQGCDTIIGQGEQSFSIRVFSIDFFFFSKWVPKFSPDLDWFKLLKSSCLFG
jgi:hypothetical protein